MSNSPVPRSAIFVPETPSSLSGALTARKEQVLTEKEVARVSGRTARELARLEGQHILAQAKEWALTSEVRQQVVDTGAEYDLGVSVASENPAAAAAVQAILSAATARRVYRNLDGR